MADIPISNYSNKFYDSDTVLKLMYEFGTQTILNLKSLNPNFDPNRVAHELLDAIPSADVQPVVHGKWEEGLCYDYYSKGVLESKCSICGSWNLFDSDGYNCESNFCPNCGADMRGKDINVTTKEDES